MWKNEEGPQRGRKRRYWGYLQNEIELWLTDGVHTCHVDKYDVLPRRVTVYATQARCVALLARALHSEVWRLSHRSHTKGLVEWILFARRLFREIVCQFFYFSQIRLQRTLTVRNLPTRSPWPMPSSTHQPLYVVHYQNVHMDQCCIDAYTQSWKT
jgi:hypothetical protein